jgi:hypothetical protein
MTNDHPLRPLVESDSGRKASSHPKEKRDCVVRATAVAFGIPYDEAHAIMEAGGRVAGKGTQDDIYYKAWSDLAERTGKRIVKHSFPAVKGKKRMNVLDFCRSHPEGTFITRQAGHVAAVIDGYLHDVNVAWWSWERCVYTAFQILPS